MYPHLKIHFVYFNPPAGFFTTPCNPTSLMFFRWGLWMNNFSPIGDTIGINGKKGRSTPRINFGP